MEEENNRYDPQMWGINVFTCPTCVYRTALHKLRSDADKWAEMEDGPEKDEESKRIAVVTSNLLDYGLEIANNTCQANEKARQGLMN